VHPHPSAQHTWPQLSVCLSCVLSASPIITHLAPVRFSSNRSERKNSLHLLVLEFSPTAPSKATFSGSAESHTPLLSFLPFHTFSSLSDFCSNGCRNSREFTYSPSHWDTGRFPVCGCLCLFLLGSTLMLTALPSWLCPRFEPWLGGRLWGSTPKGLQGHRD
jgi:hypothetical protein